MRSSITSARARSFPAYRSAKPGHVSTAAATDRKDPARVSVADVTACFMRKIQST
jgi:tRNA A37 threonylcarbamoyladenosine dehydratase